MCGIIGLYGKGAGLWPNAKRSYMLEGLIADSVRGYDSTGIALLPKDVGDHVKLYKRDLAGYDFVQQKHTNRLLDNLTQSIGMIGHNRSATKGAVNDRNAHPFKWGHITLVHNGTVYNAQSLVEKKDQPNGMVVDSEFVAHALSLEDPADILPKLSGGYSLVWFNEEDLSLNFARNDQKPMFLAFDSENETVYFASEASLIVWLCDRNNIKIQSDIFRLVPHIHYSIKDPGKVKEITKVPFVQGQYKAPKAGHIPREVWKPTAAVTPTVETNGSKDTTRSLLQPDRTEKSTDNGKEHAYSRESLSPGDASGIRKEAKGKRLEEMNEVLARHKLTNSVILAKAIAWFAYNTQYNEKVNQHGWIICEPVHEEAKGVFLQVFHVTHKQWIDEYRDSILFLEAVNFRKGKDPDQVVCRIKENLQQKHRKDGKDRPSKDSTKTEGFGLMDSGTKEDWIEIGTARKKLVHPLVYSNILRRGCWNCDGDLPNSSGEIMWIGVNDDRPVCDTCCNNPVILEALQYVQ